MVKNISKLSSCVILIFIVFTSFNTNVLADDVDDSAQVTEARYQESQGRAKKYINWVNQRAKISGFKGLWNYEVAIDKAQYCYSAEDRHQSGEIDAKDFYEACQAQMASSVKANSSLLAAFLYIHHGTTDRKIAKNYIRDGLFEINFAYSDQTERLNEIKGYVILDPLLEFPGFQFLNTDKKYAYYTHADYQAYVMVEKSKLIEYGKSIDLYDSVDTHYFKVKKWNILNTLKSWGERTGYAVTALEIEPIDLKQIPNYKNDYKPL